MIGLTSQRNQFIFSDLINPCNHTLLTMCLFGLDYLQHQIFRGMWLVHRVHLSTFYLINIFFTHNSYLHSNYCVLPLSLIIEKQSLAFSLTRFIFSGLWFSFMPLCMAVNLFFFIFPSEFPCFLNRNKWTEAFSLA